MISDEAVTNNEGSTSKSAFSSRSKKTITGRVRSLVRRPTRPKEERDSNSTLGPVVQDETRDDSVAVSHGSSEASEKVSKVTEAGNRLFARGEYDNAMKMFVEALRLSSGTERTDTGANEDSVASTKKNRATISRILVNMGAVHIQLNRYDDALKVLQSALRLATAVSDDSAKAYAEMTSNAGGSEAGVSDTSRVKADSVKADVLQNIGLAYLKKHEFNKASEHYHEASVVRRRCLEYALEQQKVISESPRSHADGAVVEEDAIKLVKICQLELADSLVSSGLGNEKCKRHQDAATVYTEALKIRRNAISDPHHPDILIILSFLGNIYAEIGGAGHGDGFYEWSLHYYTELHQLRCSKLGEQHIDVADVLNSMGRVHLRNDKPEKSLEVLTEAIKIIKLNNLEGNKAASLLAASILNNLGIVHEKLNKRDEAIRSFLDSLTYKVSVLGEDHPSLANTIHNVANAYCENEQYDQALEAYNESLRRKQSALGPNHPSVALTLNNIGAVHLWRCDYSASLKAHLKALKVWKTSLKGKESHPNIADTHNSIGVVLKRQGELDKAMDHFTAALRMYREGGAKADHPGVLTTIRNIADFEHTQEMEKSSSSVR